MRTHVLRVSVGLVIACGGGCNQCLDFATASFFSLKVESTKFGLGFRHTISSAIL